jgi:hypothetical protein
LKSLIISSSSQLKNKDDVLFSFINDITVGAAIKETKTNKRIVTIVFTWQK